MYQIISHPASEGVAVGSRIKCLTFSKKLVSKKKNKNNPICCSYIINLIVTYYFPQHIQENLSEAEKQFFANYDKNLSTYMRSFPGLDLTLDPLIPPKEGFVVVRVLQDYPAILTEYGPVNLQVRREERENEGSKEKEKENRGMERRSSKTKRRNLKIKSREEKRAKNRPIIEYQQRFVRKSDIGSFFFHLLRKTRLIFFLELLWNL